MLAIRFDRERYLAWMTGRDTSRPFFTELFGPLIGLPEQWREQGATEAEIDLSAFDWDYIDRVGCGGNTSALPLCEPEVIREDERMRITRTPLGGISQLDKTTATIGLPLEYPVTTADDWHGRVKQAFAFRPERISDAAIATARERRERGAVVQANIPGVFATLRDLMGEERACLAFYDEPELIQDIVDTLRDTATRVLQVVCDKVAIDRLMVHEDFAGRGGPLVGPAVIEQYFQPHYRAAWELCEAAGATLFGIDSDGNVEVVIPALRACGINELFPNEPAAGMDIVHVRERYGLSLKLRGGIDKFVVRNGTKQDIRHELEKKMLPLKDQGGVVFALDHRIPDGTPIESYRFYAETGREILGLEPRPAEATRFVRSA
ncbi:MAG: uroporphyrinogen decarboxylase family protein [Phycisphaeraceae bacterium]